MRVCQCHASFWWHQETQHADRNGQISLVGSVLGEVKLLRLWWSVSRTLTWAVVIKRPPAIVWQSIQADECSVAIHLNMHHYASIHIFVNTCFLYLFVPAMAHRAMAVIAAMTWQAWVNVFCGEFAEPWQLPSADQVPAIAAASSDKLNRSCELEMLVGAWR